MLVLTWVLGLLNRSPMSPAYRFMRPPDARPTRALFVGNCGPAVGLNTAAIEQLFRSCGPRPPADIVVPSEHSSHVFLLYQSEVHAQAALQDALQLHNEQNGRKFALHYAIAKPAQAQIAPSPPVARTAEALGVPGLQLLVDFITEQEEQTLLGVISKGTWHSLARRRVQHYGYEFDYATRMFGTRPVEPLPSWVSPLADRISQLPSVAQPLDQLTVNEYTPGVGLAPHIDTHSAFTGAIVSLSLGSACVMELRRGDDHRPLLLPRRSLLVLAGESRYAWQHYIPIRKTDDLGPATQRPHQAGPVQPPLGTSGPGPEGGGEQQEQGQQQPADHEVLVRGTRVSLTFRRIRGFPCDCGWPENCDSRQGGPLPTRIAALAAAPPASGRHCGTAPPPTIQADQQGLGSGSASTDSETAPITTTTTTTTGGSRCSITPGLNQAPGQLQPTVWTSSGGPPDPGATSPRGIGDAEAGVQGGGDRGDRELQALEDTHVNAVYDAIASHFSATRFAVWPKVREFIDALPPGALVADVGCGNGKYFGVRRDVAVLGSDRSAGLAEVAARRLTPAGLGPAQALRADVLQADGLALPYRDGCFDGVLCIAVLHHISSRSRRLRLLSELVRLLRLGGRALVTVWALEQEEPQRTVAKWSRIELVADTQQQVPAQVQTVGGSDYSRPDVHMAQSQDAGHETGSMSGPTKSGADFMVPWHLPFHRANVAAAAQQAVSSSSKTPPDGPGGTPGHQQQGPPAGPRQQQGGGTAGGSGVCGSTPAQVDSQKGSVVFQRYYHLFEAGELEQLVAEVPGCACVDAFYDKSNWCVVIEHRPHGSSPQ